MKTFNLRPLHSDGSEVMICLDPIHVETGDLFFVPVPRPVNSSVAPHQYPSRASYSDDLQPECKKSITLFLESPYRQANHHWPFAAASPHTPDDAMRSGASHFSEATKADPGCDVAEIPPSIQPEANSLCDVSAESLDIPFMRLIVPDNTGDRRCLYALAVDGHIVPDFDIGQR
jgi:hypothetical protein